MLGLRRHLSNSGINAKSPAHEPNIVEVIPTPPDERSNPHDDVSTPVRSHVHQTELASPTLSQANSVVVSRSRNNGRFSSLKRFSSKFTSTFLKEQHLIIQRRCEVDFGASIGRHAFNTSYEGLLKWIRTERMTRLPAKGGSWDRVLISARHFADQVERFHLDIEEFTASAADATNLVFGQCMVLLELGHTNAPALETAFNTLYQFGLELAPLLHRAELFRESQLLMELVGKAFADLLQIVTGISISFYQAVHGGRKFTKLSIFASFSSAIDTYRSRLHACTQEMWNIILEQHGVDDCHVDELKEWLSPHDSVLTFLASNQIRLGTQPEALTCVWFQPELSSFLKSTEKIMLVEGKVGSGKTTLANWTVDRLQRPIGRKHVSTISFSYDYDVIGQSRPLDMIKTLLSQILALRVGDLEIFQYIHGALRDSQSILSSEKLESMMWGVLYKCVHDVSLEQDTDLVIIVDNITDSDAVMVNAIEKLHNLALKNTGTRLIQFSQPLDKKPAHFRRVELSKENVVDDIRTIVKRKLQQHDHFEQRSMDDQETVIEELSKAANGSVLWASLTCKLIQRQADRKAFDEALTAALNGPKTINDAVKKLLLALKLDDDCERLLVMIATAKRPLRLSEVEALVHAGRSGERASGQSLLNHIRAFTVFNEGLVAISHDAVQQAILGFAGDHSLTKAIKNRHHDIVLRLLAYVGTTLSDTSEPTITCFEHTHAKNRLQSAALLEYAVRYWAVHFKATTWYKSSGELQLEKSIKEVFPRSVLFVMLEETCWSRQSFVFEAHELHDLAFRVRKAVFGEQNRAVLQSALICAVIYARIMNEARAIEWYHLAALIAKSVLGAHADITIHCCELLLQISSKHMSKSNRTIFRYREEILLIMVSSCTHRFGRTSKEVIAIYTMIRELYVYYEEHKKLEELVIIIGELTGEIGTGRRLELGQTIERERQVVLREHIHDEDIKLRDDFLLIGYDEEVREIITIDIIREEWKRIQKLKIAIEIEEGYIALWLRLSEHCHDLHECEWHELKIEIMLAYTSFLRIEKRYTEASAILIAIWTEYEHHEFSMFRSVILLMKQVSVVLKEIAISLNTMSLLTMALTIFKKCWNFFRHHHEEHSVHYIEISEEITKITKTITETMQQKITHKSITLIREVYDYYFESTETVVTTQMVEMCSSIVHLYMKQCEWSEAIVCIRKLVQKSWSSFFSESMESILLIEHLRSETVSIIIELATCYIHQKKYERAEEIYYRLYLAYYRHCKDEKLVEKYRNKLIHFYQEHNLFVKLISFYQTLLVEYREKYKYGSITIQLLYTLGELCRKHSSKYGYWLEYYLEIVINLKIDKIRYHNDAFKALIVIAKHYYEELRYSESLKYYELIFEYFFVEERCHFEHFKEVIHMRLLIKEYFRCIEESKLSVEMYIRILKRLQQHCRLVYKEKHEIFVEVTLMLCETYERSVTHQFEAISLYELLIQHSSVSTTVIKRVHKSLHTLYVKQVTIEEKKVTKETLERSITIVHQRYIEIRKEHSCTHEMSLTVLKELVMLYYKLSKFDLKHVEIALTEIQKIIIDIVKETDSAKEMIEAAIIIAEMYISCGWQERGLKIIYELKRQFIYKSIGVHFGFDVIKYGRKCFAFLAAFEYHLRLKMSIGYYMRLLIAEHLYYERFTSAKSLKMVLIWGSKLRQILQKTDRLTDFEFIEKKAIHYFEHSETKVVKNSNSTAITSFVKIVLEYYSESHTWKSWTAAAGFAAVKKLEKLLAAGQHGGAYELAKCTFHFLMAHEGLDDPTEITLGFKLALMMAGRTHNTHKHGNAEIHKSMLELSKHILDEVFKICDAAKFDLARCQFSELNQLIILLGDQQNYTRLSIVLELLWTSRAGQTTWSPETILYLGKRLVQALFASGQKSKAIQLCETIAYNVRRTSGSRHHQTLAFQILLSSMYTSLADEYVKSNDKKRKDMAKLYYKKAIHVHEESLKLIVNSDELDGSDSDDDENHSVIAFAWRDRLQELKYVRIHTTCLRLALQRHGGVIDARHKKNLEKLMKAVWDGYGSDKEFKASKEHVLCDHWKLEGFGEGKAELDITEDGYRKPAVWWIERTA